MDAKEAQSHDVESEASHGQGTYSTTNQGHLHRGLKERHVQFIALGGTIGTGLFLGIGSALATSGPLSLFLGYVFTSMAIWAMMQCLGEMTSLLPLPGMIAQLGTRFVDPALGFAIGWNQWYNCAIAICTETSGAVILISYWTDINPAAWISLILALIIILNVVAVSIYGEAEFAFASIKIITIIGLLILAVVIDLGGGPTHDRLGFRYWKHPGAMREYIVEGSAGRFLGLFNTLINAAFSFGGVEQVAVAAGETRNPTKNIPKAIRRVFWRLLFFYVFGSLAVGVLVPYDNDQLLNGGSKTARSPWLIAASSAGIPVLPHILNAVVVTSAASSANANLYTGSRYLFALAQQGQAPRFLLRCTRRGVPIYCVGITSSIGLLTYMTVSSGGANVFRWFSSLTTIAYLLTWTSICYAYTRFRRGIKASNIDRTTLPFQAACQPIAAWAAIAFFAIVLLFNGFSVFVHGRWSTQGFISAYIGLPIFGLLYSGYKIVMKSKRVAISEMDFVTGQVVDEDQPQQDDSESSNEMKSTLQKMWKKIF